MPFQYFSSNCYLTFGRTESDSAFDLESEALCTSKHSKITPLTNGVVIFSTLRGRPSSNNYENSQILRDFTTAEKLRFTLVRLNTFGDEIFGDPQVLQLGFRIAQHFLTASAFLVPPLIFYSKIFRRILFLGAIMIEIEQDFGQITSKTLKALKFRASIFLSASLT